MKWGVRRTPEQLGRGVDKLTKKNKQLKKDIDQYETDANTYANKALARTRKNAKYEARVSKATQKLNKYEAKLNKALSKRHINEDKVAKLSVKRAKMERKINKANAKIKYNKWAVKSDEARQYAADAKQKMLKNEKVINMLNRTIDGINDGTVRQGKYFMEYLKEED